jgi:photosystem II stability/assembly factor-like uncharacterized protein
VKPVGWLFALAVIGYAQQPFELKWTDGRCVGCKIARDLGHIQFVSRTEAWAVGYFFPSAPGAQGAGDYIVVHTKDAGRTWRELRQTYQHVGDADGPPAFWFIDAARGWISWWDPAREPEMIRTQDGGRYWHNVSGQSLQRVRFFDQHR